MTFEVDTDRVGNTVSKLQSTLSAITKNRTNMYNAINELNGTWRGTAHDAFAAQCAADNAELTRLIKEIQTVFSDIDKAKRAYVSCEQQVKNSIQGINI